MPQHLYIGVDGGATKSIIRVENAGGELLGQKTSGPANIRISVSQAWHSINSALEAILKPLGITFEKSPYLHVGMGLAGCEMHEAYQAFINEAHIFETLLVSSDSHTACLGAHGGHDGAIIIAGTGVVGFQMQAGETVKVGGWGFPHDDEGGGAWLGLEAVKETFQWLDGRTKESALARAIFNYFVEDQAQLISWTNTANSTAFAELAPLVIHEAQLGDTVAIKLMQRAAEAINLIGATLHAAQVEKSAPLPCSLVGGIAPFLEPYFNASLRARLRPCKYQPDTGALLLVRHYLDHRKDIHD